MVTVIGLIDGKEYYSPEKDDIVCTKINGASNGVSHNAMYLAYTDKALTTKKKINLRFALTVDRVSTSES